MAHAAPAPRWLLPFLLAWVLLAVSLAASGLLQRAPAPALPAMIFGLVGVGLFAMKRSEPLRAWVSAMDPRPLILLHVVRIAFGYAFLRLAAAGRLPQAFADVAGPGDLVAGGLAIAAALAAGDLGVSRRRALVSGWNLFGLLDMLAVVMTAQRLMIIVGDPRMRGLVEIFPLGVLPICVVPLVILSHFAMFVRLRVAAQA